MLENVKQAMKMREEMNSYKKILEETKVKASSKRDYVKVTLDGEKTLKQIEFSDDAMKLSKEELAKYVREAMKTASKELEAIQKKTFKNSPMANLLQGR
ncbi:MAG: YbaB/EbfC family nucleoid-associated protein [Brevinema sp.]